MKRKFTTMGGALLLAAASLPASAWDVTQAPAYATPPVPENSLAKLAKAPLNVGRDLGVDMFASVLVDRDLDHSLAWFKSERPYSLNKTIKVFPANDAEHSRMYGMVTGCGTPDGYYYGYRVKMYTFENRVDAFLKINPETGEFTELNYWGGDQAYQVQWSQRYIYDMTYNPADGKVYAVATDPDSGGESGRPVCSLLMEVNLKDGSTKQVASLPSYYFAMAFDWDGKLYGVTWTFTGSGENVNITGTRLDRLDPDLGYEADRQTPLLVDDKAFYPYYQHGMAFDYTTGDLWWLATEPVEGSTILNQLLVKIDPDTGETVNKGKVGQVEELVGLHIPYRTADARTAPAKVENLSYEGDAAGENKMTLRWTNPTTRWNRRALDNLQEVLIFRDNMEGDPVGRVDAVGMEGKQMSYTDEGASRGVHTYYVVPCCVKDEFGIWESIDAFVGHDVPGPVTNLFARSSDGRSVTVTWDLPERGDSEGWFDSSDLSYTVTRLPDNKTVAENIKERTLTDSDIPTATLYTYRVVAISADGEGTPTESDEVFAGKNVAVPFETDFEQSVEANRFVSIDANMDGNRFVHDMSPVVLRKCMTFEMNQSANDDYLVTPPLALKKGRTYRVDLDIAGLRYGYDYESTVHRFNFVGGESSGEQGLTDVLSEPEDFELTGLTPRERLSVDFVAPSETYYVAFHVQSEPGEDYFLYATNFRIIEVMDNDLAVSDFTTHLSLSGSGDNEFEVEVWNYGTNPQSDYKVKVGTVNGEGVFFPFAETDKVPALEPGEKAVLKLAGHPLADGADVFVAAEVELAGDENSENNRSREWLARVYDGDPINVTVTGDPVEEDSSAPVYHYTVHSATQTLYTSKMMNFPPDVEEVALSSLSWKYRGEASTSTMNVRIYLGQTSSTGFDSETKEWYTEGQEKVFDGTIALREGQNYMTALLDKPYVFDPNLSLIVTVVKNDNALAGSFPFFFDVFDRDWDAYVFHTMTYRGNTAFDLSNVSGLNEDSQYVLPIAPVLHMGCKYETGVRELTAGRPANGNFFYDAASKTLRFDGSEISEVRIYGLDGRELASTAVSDGATAVAVRVAPGMYVATATDAAGKTYTLKFNVGR